MKPKVARSRSARNSFIDLGKKVLCQWFFSTSFYFIFVLSSPLFCHITTQSQGQVGEAKHKNIENDSEYY